MNTSQERKEMPVARTNSPLEAPPPWASIFGDRVRIILPIYQKERNQEKEHHIWKDLFLSLKRKAQKQKIDHVGTWEMKCTEKQRIWSKVWCLHSVTRAIQRGRFAEAPSAGRGWRQIPGRVVSPRSAAGRASTGSTGAGSKRQRANEINQDG